MLKLILDPSKRIYFLLVSLCILTNVYIASLSASSVPLIDGWALWNQIMLLNLGELSFHDYIFSYFGTHPHSIIKLLGWLDYKITGGRQLLTALASLFSSASLGLFLAYLFLSWSKKNLKKSPYVLIAGAIIAFLCTDLADMEVMTLPFQAVLSISRLSYIVILWSLLKVAEKKSDSEFMLLTLLASVATTFHGAGFIFAIVWLMIVLVLCRRILHIAFAFSPIATWIIQAHFYKVGGELDGIVKLISMQGILDVSSAFLLYFAAPLSFLYHESNKILFMVAGIIIATFTVGLGSAGVFNLVRYRIKRPASTVVNDELIYAGVLCIFVILSGLAAAVLMTVRAGSSADLQVLTTYRYIAYAILPYIFLMAFVIKLSQKIIAARYIAPACVLFILFISAYPTFKHEGNQSVKLGLDKSIALISVGFSPLKSDAVNIWPSAKDDWYWVNALPQTISYLKDNKLGPWHNLPFLGQSYVKKNGIINETIAIENLIYSDLKTGHECSLNSFTGTLKINFPSTQLDSGVFPILDIDGVVVGFAYQNDLSNSKNVAGFVNNSITHKTSFLNLGPRDDRYIGKSVGNFITSYNLTDVTWEGGIARNWPGFFVEDSVKNRTLLSPGKSLRFNDGSFRTIDNLKVANGYLNIYTGNPKINVTNGFPKEIEIIDWCKPPH